MGPTQQTDRQILESILRAAEMVVDALRALTQALRSSDLRRDSTDRALLDRIDRYTGEVQSGLMAILGELGKREVTATADGDGGMQVTVGSGKSTTRLQLAGTHWAKVRPIVWWVATTALTGLGLGKLLSLGGP